MRDAESILDQLLSMTSDVVTEAAVRDLLGLADAAAVDGFVEALLTGDAAAGIGILDRLEERGRDPRALLDQVVDAVRSGLVQEATTGGTDRGAALAAAARRLVAIDPDRAGIGGLRLQLELALFAAGPSAGPAPTITPAAEPSPRERAEASARPSGPTPTQPRAARASTASAAPAPKVERQPPVAPTPPAAEPTSQVPESPPVAATPAPAVTASSPEASPASTASATPDANGTNLSLDRIVAAWPAIVAVLSTQPAIKQLILTCRPVALDGVIVTLGYPEEQAFLREIAERKKANIEAGIREVVGHDVGVRCIVANIEVPAPATAGDDGFLMAEARRIFGDDLADVVEID
jgi:DNA polymerase III gamma/tau subunit